MQFYTDMKAGYKLCRTGKHSNDSFYPQVDRLFTSSQHMQIANSSFTFSLKIQSHGYVYSRYLLGANLQS